MRYSRESRTAGACLTGRTLHLNVSLPSSIVFLCQKNLQNDLERVASALAYKTLCLTVVSPLAREGVGFGFT